MAIDASHVTQMRTDLDADLGGDRTFAEKKMFGGLCFLLDGNMVACISARGALYRPGPAAEATALALPGVTPMIHGGRRMGGFVWLDLATFAGDEVTRRRLAAMALAFAEGLPAKD